VSNFLKHHLVHLREHSPVVPAVNQFEIHPLLWESSTIDYCREHKIAIEAYSPLARQDERLFKSDVMLALSKKYNKTVAQLSLRWCLQHGFIVLPKSKNPQRIEENVGIYDFEISDEDMKKITGLTKKHVRTCWDPNNVKF
jgi:diketogulonate reductase-like aldo/keto reductase